MKETRSTCPYCGVGCGVIIQSDDKQITGVRGDPDHPANFGRLCSKGSSLHLTASNVVAMQTRLLQPMWRSKRDALANPVSWDSALDLVSQRFSEIILKNGPDALGFYVSGQLLTEDYYVFNKLVKGLIGTNNIDSNSRLCMSSAVAGYKKTLGSDAPPACYDDIKHAQTLFIAGSNTAFAHPILFRRIEDARRANPSLKIIVVDPRRTDTADAADLHLAIQPGTDVMLFNGMLHLMLWEGWIDQAYISNHTQGFENLKARVREDTPQRVSQICGIQQEDLHKAARWFSGLDDGTTSNSRQPTISLYCQGLNQSTSGTDKNAALINLHLATGQIGKPGAGPFSLTGQPNAMGGREVGAMANLLSAHRDLNNPQHRHEVANIWGIPEVPSKPGKTAVEMFEAAAEGEIKGLWIACTNPAQSMPNQAMVRRALERAEFVVVQEAFATTATCKYADVLLPATTWGEKEGTVTNSERRISRVRVAVKPPVTSTPSTSNSPRHDWAIAVDFAKRLEKKLGRPKSTLFPYSDVESIWNEHRETTRGRDLDITGLSYKLLDQAPRQWPFPDGTLASDQGKKRLYTDGKFPTADQRAHFAAVDYQSVAEPVSNRFPLALTTGRLRDQWHGMSRTGTVPRLLGHSPEPALLMHPHNMAQRLLKQGDLVHVTSQRGSITLPVQSSLEQSIGQVFMAMHWGEEYLSGQDSNGNALNGVNSLTTTAFCPISKQPEFKHSAVKVLKAELPWQLMSMAWLPDNEVLAAQESLRKLLKEFSFSSCVPFSSAAAINEHEGNRSGIQLRAASYETIQRDLIHEIENILSLNGSNLLCYNDTKHGQRRSMKLCKKSENTVLEGFLLAGDASAQNWISELLIRGLPVQSYGRSLLKPSKTPPTEIKSAGKVVCTCFNVSDILIHEQLKNSAGSAQEMIVSLQENLKCGTNCGSCIPQLQRIVREFKV